MKKYMLDPKWVKVVLDFSQFANGATQVSMRTKDGQVYGGILLSNCSAVIAMRGHEDLPFKLSDVVEIFQTEDDENPENRGGWHFWDKWERPA